MTPKPQTYSASVIIPARNAKNWLPLQLEALAGQIEPPPFEVIVADNGSTDDTKSTVQPFISSLDIQVVNASGVSSASHARNVGAAAAAGEVLLFCDADDIVNDRWVKYHVQAVIMSDGAISAGAQHHEHANRPAVLEAYSIDPDPDLPVDLDRMPAYLDDAKPFAGLLPTVQGGNFAIRRDDYLRLGGMDSSYPGGSEETDFVWRAQIEGMRVVRVPQAFIQYRLRSDAKAIFRQQRIQQRARMLLWTRFRDHGMSGPSWRGSISSIVHEAIRSSRHARSADDILTSARRIGGHVGALEGMLKYRVLKAPPRRLANHANFPTGISSTAPTPSQDLKKRALRSLKSRTLNVVRRGTQIVDYPVDNARLGNLLYIWMHGMICQRAGADYRVAVTANTEPWREYFPSLDRDILVPRNQVRLTARRLSGEFYQEFDRHFTAEDLRDFCARYLLDSPLMRQFEAEAIDLGVRDAQQVTVNVRRGDYYSVPQHRDRYGLDIEGFVSAAIQEQLKFGPISDVYLISDDVPWCLEHLAYLEERGITLHASPSSSPARDLALLGHSDRLILTNSTFSYWGGYMATVRNPHSNSVVPLFHAKDWLNGRAFQLHPDWTALPGFGED